MSTIPKVTDPVAAQVTLGLGLARRLEADARVKDVAPPVRAGAEKLAQANDTAQAAKREVWLHRDVLVVAEARVTDALHKVELQARMETGGRKNGTVYRTAFPNGLKPFLAGKAEARFQRLQAHAMALGGVPGLEAGAKELADALAACEAARTGYRAARVDYRVAVGAVQDARVAFMTAYKVALADTTVRLGDPKAAKALFPKLPAAGDGATGKDAEPGHEAPAPAAAPVAVESHAA